MSLFGPLFRYELTRLARRGTQPKLRAAFAGLLLVALFLAYLAAFPGNSPYKILTHIDEPLTVQATSRFGERFLISFLFIQAAVVLLITPAIAAGAIGEEKEAGSLDLLLTTPLTPWEIVGGKFAARMVFLGSLLFTSLPVVILVIDFGGVDITRLIAGYAIALLTLLSLGSFSFYLSVIRGTLGSTLLRVYLYAVVVAVLGLVLRGLGPPVFFSPFGTLLVMFEGRIQFLGGPSTMAQPRTLVMLYAVIHGAMATLCLTQAILRLGQLDQPHARTDRKDDFEFYMPGEKRPSRVQVFQPTRLPRSWSVPRVNEADPLGWKERHFDGFFPWLQSRGVIVVAVGSVPLLMLLAWVIGAKFVVGAVVLSVILTGIGASACVARERQRGTLDALLLFPRPRSEILHAKLRTVFGSGRWVTLVPLGSAAVVGLYLDAAGAAVFAMPFVFIGWLLAAAGYGLWLSVRCATVERAVAYWFTGFILLCIFPQLLAPIVRESLASPNVRSEDNDALFAGAICEGFSPIIGPMNALPRQRDWAEDALQSWRSSRSSTRFQAVRIAYLGALIASVVAGIGGWFLAWVAEAEFELNEN